MQNKTQNIDAHGYLSKYHIVQFKLLVVGYREFYYYFGHIQVFISEENIAECITLYTQKCESRPGTRMHIHSLTTTLYAENTCIETMVLHAH